MSVVNPKPHPEYLADLGAAAEQVGRLLRLLGQVITLAHASPLLPSRPNSSAGWITDSELDQAVTPYLIRVHLGSFTMELFKKGQRLGSWTIGIGKTSAPTPPGRTFLLGSFTDPKQNWSPIILPLGTHSPTLDSFGGGPGTVALHTWPTADVFGIRSSDGCIRVPPDALRQLTEVPLGTLVLIDED